MKYLKYYEAKKHKYKVGDWVLVNIEDENFLESGEILEVNSLAGREDQNNLSYTVDFYNKIPEELDYMRYGDENSTLCLVEQAEIKRLLNKKEIEQAKLKKMAKRYNL